MDIGSHRVAVNPKRSKTHQEVALSLKNTWENIGIPFFLQLDNQLCCRGSNRYPRSSGLVIRLCLLLGAQPIFIPLGEPWRNGCIEKSGFLIFKIYTSRPKDLKSFTIRIVVTVVLTGKPRMKY